MPNKFPESFKQAILDDPNAHAIWEAIQLLKSGIKTGMDDLQALAAEGSSLSMFYLAHAYEGNLGITVDDELSAYWHRMAASHGSIESEYRIAYAAWLNALFDVALNGFEKLANKNFAPAIYFIGLMYYHGVMFQKDIDMAYRKWKVSAKLGHIYALNRVSFILTENRQGIRNKFMGWYLRFYTTCLAEFWVLYYPASDRLRIDPR